MKRTEREAAIRLRQDGRSIKEIARTLRVSTSSVSLWVKHVTLADHHLNGLIQRVRLNGVNVGRARAAAYQALDEKQRGEGYELAARDDVFRVIFGMYWGEGAKTNNLFNIANADPHFIRVVCAWLEKMEVNPASVQFRFQYHRANGYPLEAIVNYWLTEVPYLQNCVLRKCKCVESSYPPKLRLIGKCPHGTCTLYVHKSRRLYNWIMGGIGFLHEGLLGD